MATLSAKSSDKMLNISQFLGLNENEDGGVNLKIGEAITMKNWKITRDGNLKTRPGTNIIYTSNWKRSGYLDESKVEKHYRYICDSEEIHLFVETRYTVDNHKLSRIIRFDSEMNPVQIYAPSDSSYWISEFGYQFRDAFYFIYKTEENSFIGILKIYKNNGSLTYQLLTNTVGPTLSDHTYIPVLYTGCTWSTSGKALEQINIASKWRSLDYTTDGTHATFYIHTGGEPIDVSNVLIRNNVTNTFYTLGTDYTYDSATYSVTFSTVPVEGLNLLRIYYRTTTDDSGLLVNINVSELYSGNTDTTLFFGNQTDTVRHLGADELGDIDATFFPAMGEVRIGADNDSVTGMIRHGSDLIVYKNYSTWKVDFGTMTASDGNIIEAFTVIPVHRTVGSMCQPELINGNPTVPFASDIYQFANNSYYSNSLSYSEAQCQRISDRVHHTIESSGILSITDSDYTTEAIFLLGDNRELLIWNYAINVWYKYEYSFDIINIIKYPFNEISFLCNDGTIRVVNDNIAYDLNADSTRTVPECHWVSGDMNFGAPYMRKFVSALWVTFKPSGCFYTEVGAITDKKQSEVLRAIKNNQFSWEAIILDGWEYLIERDSPIVVGNEPIVKKLKLKSKKFTHYRLIFRNKPVETTSDFYSDGASIINCSIKYRTTGEAK